MLRTTAASAAVAFFFAVTTTTFAAPSQDDLSRASRQADQIQREEQNRLRQQLDMERDRGKPPTQLDMPAPAPKAPNTGTACKQINSIVFDGAEHLSEETRADLNSPFVARCLTGSDIEKLMASITTHYMERGYTTSRVYVPKQDLNTGTLRLRILEGTIESIRLNDGNRDSINLATAIPARAGDVFNLRDFEQGLDQINRLSSNNATLDIEPGTDAGSSVVVIRNEPQKRWTLSFTGDNTGNDATGRRQAGTNASFDNLLGLNEFISLSARRSDPVYGKDKESNSQSATVSVPLGYSTLTASLAKSDYRSTIQTQSGPLITEGRTDSGMLILDHVLTRGADYRIGLSGGFGLKDTKNYVAKEILETGSRKLATADIDLNGNTSLLGGIISGSVGYTRGTSFLGARNDINRLPDNGAHAQFDKWRYSVSWMRPFTIAGYQTSFSTALTGQHAQQVLFGTEQLSMTGYTAVRGFNETSLAGDRGWYLRNDLSTLIPVGPADWKLALRPHVGLDGGHVLNHKDARGGSAAGWASGITFIAGPVSLDITYTDQIYHPIALEPEKGFTFVKLSTSF